MPKYNDISLIPTTTSSSGGGGVSSITLNNGVTSITGDTALINAKATGTLDVVQSIVRGSNTVLGVLDVTGTSLFRSAGKFNNGLDVSGSLTTTGATTSGSISTGRLTAGALSTLATVTSGSLTATSLTSTGVLSGQSVTVGAGGINTSTLTATGDSNLSTINAGTVNVSGLKATYSLIANGPTTLTTLAATGISGQTLTIVGASSLSTLAVSGATTAGPISMVGLLDVFGSTKFRSSCQIDNHLTVANSLTSGTLGVTGLTTLNTLTATGVTNVATLNISGPTTFSSGFITNASSTVGLLNINSSLFAYGPALFSNNVDINQNLTVTKIYEKTAFMDTSTLVCDMSISSSFVLPASFQPTANYTITITNIPQDVNKSFSVSVMSRQTTTSFYANNIKAINVSGIYISGSSTSVASPIFNGGTPTLSTSPCLMIQTFNIITIPTTSAATDFTRFVTSSVNSHY